MRWPRRRHSPSRPSPSALLRSASGHHPPTTRKSSGFPKVVTCSLTSSSLRLYLQMPFTSFIAHANRITSFSLGAFTHPPNLSGEPTHARVGHLRYDAQRKLSKRGVSVSSAARGGRAGTRARREKMPWNIFTEGVLLSRDGCCSRMLLERIRMCARRASNEMI